MKILTVLLPALLISGSFIFMGLLTWKDFKNIDELTKVEESLELVTDTGEFQTRISGSCQ